MKALSEGFPKRGGVQIFVNKSVDLRLQVEKHLV